MFPMSLKSVPGCLVSMPPRTIGVPVALTPGFVPQADVLTAGVLAVGALLAAPLELLLLELRLLQAPSTPASASTAIAKPARDERLCSFLFIYFCLLVAL
jgi:hypothetical protein